MFWTKHYGTKLFVAKAELKKEVAFIPTVNEALFVKRYI